MSFSIYQLKPRFQRLIEPLLGALIAAGVTPNQVTVFTAGLMTVYGAALAAWPGQHRLWLGLVLVMPVRMVLNALDGMLAQRTQQQTPLGAVLNEVCDLVSDLALYLPFAMLPGVNAGLAVVAAALAAVAETTGLAALAAGHPRRFDGPMGKSDRAFAYGVAGLIAGLGGAPGWIDSLQVVVLVLLVWTIANRLRRAVD